MTSPSGHVSAAAGCCYPCNSYSTTESLAIEAENVGDRQPRFIVECLIYDSVLKPWNEVTMASTNLPSSPEDGWDSAPSPLGA